MFFHLEEVLDSAEDSAAIESVLSQLKDPDQFVSKVKYLYEHPEMESFDTIELKDGRVLERFSCPQRMDDKPIGRVWNFRDITLRRKAEQQKWKEILENRCRLSFCLVFRLANQYS